MVAFVLMLARGSALAGSETPARPYTVESYDVSVRPDLAKKVLYGEAKIQLRGLGDNEVSALEFDAAGMKVTGVLEDKAPQAFDQTREMLYVTLLNALHPDQERTIIIQYQAKPADGLKFFPNEVDAFVTPDWLPCNNLPAERATLHLTIAAPADAKTAGSGDPAGSRITEGQSVTEWQLETPSPPSRFGFAVGAFTEAASEADGVEAHGVEAHGVKLRALGVDKSIFDPAAAAMRYFADRTGKPYPGKSYTQVAVQADVSRSMAGGLAFLPQSWAHDFAKQPDNILPIADQLARQWFGVEIAPKTWADAWLSQGVPAFLADTFLEQRFGKEKFDRRMAQLRETWNQLRMEGKDRPLDDSDAVAPPPASGGIPEHKGAWFVYLLQQFVGDKAFWSALKLYTSDNWGKAVSSEDFQRAFDAVNTGARLHAGSIAKNSPKKLDDFFNMWVYGVTSAKPKSR